MKWVYIFLIITIIAGVIGVSGCLQDNYNDSTTPTDKNFENQFISFNHTSNSYALDNSTNEKLNVLLFDNGKLIGEIKSTNTTPGNAAYLQSSKIIVANKPTTELANSDGINAFIKLNDKLNLLIDFEQDYTGEYKLIKNTLIIKKEPTQ